MGYREVVLADSPVAYWRLNDTGSSAADETGNGNTGTVSATGVTVSQPGALRTDSDNGMVFTPANSGRVTISPASPTTITAPYSVEGWTKLANVPGFHAMFGTRGGTDHSFEISYDSTIPGISGLIGDGAGTWMTTAANYVFTAVAGTWYHVVITVTSTTYVIYVNGPQVATGTYSSATPLLWNSTHGPSIGSYSQAGAEFFDGTLDELAVYTAVLSAAQVLNHYNVGITPEPPRMLGAQAVKRAAYY